MSSDGGAEPDLDVEDAPPPVFLMKPGERAAYLEQLFLAYDVDHSGEIDNTELFQILNVLQIRTNPRVAETMLQEMDQDRSGAIDMEEFKEFFRRIREFETLKGVMGKNDMKTQARGRVMICYLLIVVLSTFVVATAYLNAASSPEGASQELTVGFTIVIVTSVTSICFVLVWPLIALKWSSWTHVRGEHLRRALDEAQRLRAASRAAAAVRRAELAQQEDPVQLERAPDAQELGSYRRTRNEQNGFPPLPGQADAMSVRSTSQSLRSGSRRQRRSVEEVHEELDQELGGYDPEAYDPRRAPTQLPWDHTASVLTFSTFSQNRVAPY